MLTPVLLSVSFLEKPFFTIFSHFVCIYLFIATKIAVFHILPPFMLPSHNLSFQMHTVQTTTCYPINCPIISKVSYSACRLPECTFSVIFHHFCCQDHYDGEISGDKSSNILRPCLRSLMRLCNPI